MFLDSSVGLASPRNSRPLSGSHETRSDYRPIPPSTRTPFGLLIPSPFHSGLRFTESAEAFLTSASLWPWPPGRLAAQACQWSLAGAPGRRARGRSQAFLARTGSGPTCRHLCAAAPTGFRGVDSESKNWYNISSLGRVSGSCGRREAIRFLRRSPPVGREAAPGRDSQERVPAAAIREGLRECTGGIVGAAPQALQSTFSC